MTTRQQPSRSRVGRHHPVCPTCGWAPNSDPEAERLREELQNRLVVGHGNQPDQVIRTRHCGHCQPHTVYVVACMVCCDGPILAGQLANDTLDADPHQLPSIVVDQLTAAGWRWGTGPLASGWACCR